MKFFQKLLINSLWEPTGEVDRGRRAGSSTWRGDLMAQSLWRQLCKALLGLAIASFLCSSNRLLYWMEPAFLTLVRIGPRKLDGRKRHFSALLSWNYEKQNAIFACSFSAVKMALLSWNYEKIPFFRMGYPLMTTSFQTQIFKDTVVISRKSLSSRWVLI